MLAVGEGITQRERASGRVGHEDDAVCSNHISPKRLQLIHQFFNRVERWVRSDLGMPRTALIIVDNLVQIPEEIQAALEAVAGMTGAPMEDDDG
jgi:hypothetical protein